MKKCLLLVLLFIMFIPFIVNAETCDVDKIKIKNITVQNKNDTVGTERMQKLMDGEAYLNTEEKD